jgi:hypothetical protein
VCFREHSSSLSLSLFTLFTVREIRARGEQTKENTPMMNSYYPGADADEPSRPSRQKEQENHMMTAEDRTAELEAEVHRLRMEIDLLKADIVGLRRLPGMNTKHADRLLPLYALLGTRVRAIEERFYSRDEAGAVHEYWVRALRALGINPDPLNLENNE